MTAEGFFKAGTSTANNNNNNLSSSATNANSEKQHKQLQQILSSREESNNTILSNGTSTNAPSHLPKPKLVHLADTARHDQRPKRVFPTSIPDALTNAVKSRDGHVSATRERDSQNNPQ